VSGQRKRCDEGEALIRDADNLSLEHVPPHAAFNGRSYKGTT